MLEIPFDETVNLLVDTGPSRFRCRGILPGERELVDV